MPRKGRVLPLDFGIVRPKPEKSRKELKVNLTGRSNGDVEVQVLDFNGKELDPGKILFSRYDIVGNSTMTLEVPVEWWNE